MSNCLRYSEWLLCRECEHQPAATFQVNKKDFGRTIVCTDCFTRMMLAGDLLPIEEMNVVYLERIIEEPVVVDEDEGDDAVVVQTDRLP